MKRAIVGLLAACVVTFAALVLAFYCYAGWEGLGAALRGRPLWVTVDPDDRRLPQSMRLALQARVPQALPGTFVWTERVAGFDTGELPVLVNGVEADRIFLARVDPARFRFEVLNKSSSDRNLSDWVATLNAILVVNGSYFGRDALPSTPTVSNGVRLGPTTYDARHGAFVVSDTFTGIRDLRGADWRDVLRGATDAVVSYPMLLRIDSGDDLRTDRRWLANRSFIAQDKAGRIVIGTTQQAFFSLDRLASFLRAAPLDLVMALNLDGGSVACQGISLGGFARAFCGGWETKTEGDKIKLLLPYPLVSRHALPNVVAVLPK